MSNPDRITHREAMKKLRREVREASDVVQGYDHRGNPVDHPISVASPRIRAAIARRDRRAAEREAAYQLEMTMRDRAGNLMADWRETAMVEIPRPGEFARPVTTGQQLVVTTDGGEQFLVTFQYLGQVKP